MDELDIVKICGGLSLTEEEEIVTVMDGETRMAGEQKRDLCLGGKIIANKQDNNETFRINILKIWRTNQPFGVEIIISNTFVFHFRSLADKRRVMAGRPWHFDNHLLVLEELSKFGEVDVMEFCKVEFWIQLHNIPICFTTKEASIFLGGQLGKLIDIDESGTGNRGGNSIRIRVEIDIRKSLKRFLKVDMSGKRDFKFLLVRYERLPAFCFHCGVIGHGDRECSITSGADRAEKTKTQRQYGAWMRADSPQKKHYGRAWKEENNDPLKWQGLVKNGTEGQSSGKKSAMSKNQVAGRDNSKGIETGGRRIASEDSCQKEPNRSKTKVERLEVPSQEATVACREVEKVNKCQEDMVVETEVLIVTNMQEMVTEESGNIMPFVNHGIQRKESETVFKGKMQGNQKGLDNGPSVKGKWKRAARRAQSSSKGLQEGRSRNKRALEEEEALEKGCIKKLKGCQENFESLNSLTAAFGGSPTSNLQAP